LQREQEARYYTTAAAAMPGARGPRRRCPAKCRHGRCNQKPNPQISHVILPVSGYYADDSHLIVGAELAIEEAILDGEVIAPDETGRPVFLDLLKGSARPAYIAFDLLRVNGCDQRGLPLSERRRALQPILPPGSRVVSEALSVVGRGRSLLALTREHDLEGIVAKKLADPYEPSTRWLKIKNPAYSQSVGRAGLFNHSGKRAKQFPIPPLSKP
jgi:ATP-dependent DNA ligase